MVIFPSLWQLNVCMRKLFIAQCKVKVQSSNSQGYLGGYLGNDRFEKLQPRPVLSLPPALVCANGPTVHETPPLVKTPPPALYLLLVLALPRHVTHFSEFVSDDELSND